MLVACKFWRLPGSSSRVGAQLRSFSTANEAVVQSRPEKQFFSASRPEFFEAVKLEGAILIKHPSPPTVTQTPPRIVEDDKKSTPPPLRLVLKPEEIEEVKRLRFNDPFGWSQNALARHFHTTGEVIGKIIREPSTKKKSIKELYVPKRRDTLGRRRWTASMRIKKGLPPLEEPLPEPKILPTKKVRALL